jgi:putative flippase GtrA
VRYGFASALALAVDAGLIWVLHKWFDVHYLWAAAIGFMTGCGVTYVLSKTMVFDNNSGRSERSMLILFWLVGVAGLGLNQVVMYIGVDIVSLPVMAAKAVSALFVFWFNFFLRGSVVFKDPDLRTTQKNKQN